MSRAIVLLSGGQDSATCLFWAKQKFTDVEALFLHYEQRHHIEYQSAKTICSRGGVPLHELTVPVFRELGGTAMIEDITIENTSTGVPNTFVPGRNILFLTLAAAQAYKLNAEHVVIGVNEEDYSGYPDCREGFIKSMEQSLSLGLDHPLKIHTPLQHLDKAGIWNLADELHVLDMIVKETHTCYIGDHSHFHEWGFGCGECPACKLREAGFHKFQMIRKK